MWLFTIYTSHYQSNRVSPDKKDIKPEQVKSFSDSKQGEELLLKENALLRHIVAHQKEEIQMYRKSLQGD